MVERVATKVAVTDLSRKNVSSPVTHSSIATRGSGSRGGQVRHGVALAWTSSTDDFHAHQFGRESARSSAGLFPMAHAGSSSALRRGGGHAMSGADVRTGGRATFLGLASHLFAIIELSTNS